MYAINAGQQVLHISQLVGHAALECSHVGVHIVLSLSNHSWCFCCYMFFTNACICTVDCNGYVSSTMANITMQQKTHNSNQFGTRTVHFYVYVYIISTVQDSPRGHSDVTASSEQRPILESTPALESHSNSTRKIQE